MLFPAQRVLMFISPISCLLPGFVTNTRSPLVEHTDFRQASFKQVFRFTFSKREAGTCNDLSTYRDLLETALDASEKCLPSLCMVQNPDDRITGQLIISDITEQSKSILINISLLYDHRPSSVYEQCRGLVASAFQRDNGNVTAPFRKSFFPLLCPAIVNTHGGVLVHSGYFCRLPNQVRTRMQPQGFSHPIDVCAYCPLGEEVTPGSDVCTECQQGFFKSLKTTAICEPCPDHFVTRINGSTTKDDCQLRACEAGFYADVYNGGQCTSCPYGTYQPEKWKEHCIHCPAGLITYHVGAASQALCLPICPPGQEYTNSTKSCRPCSIGYFKDGKNPARQQCTMCSLEYITAREGATSSQECNVRNCSQAGHYLDVKHNVCRACPRGQWQNRKWQTSCIPCDDGHTTRLTGTVHPSYCFVLEEEGLKLTKEEIIYLWSQCWFFLLLPNTIIVGYCLYTRSRRRKEKINNTTGSGNSGDIFKLTGLESRRSSGTYEDIEMYDTIRNIVPFSMNPSTSTSTFKPTDEQEASSHSYDNLNVYLQPNMPVMCIQAMVLSFLMTLALRIQCTTMSSTHAPSIRMLAHGLLLLNKIRMMNCGLQTLMFCTSNMAADVPLER